MTSFVLSTVIFAGVDLMFFLNLAFFINAAIRSARNRTTARAPRITANEESWGEIIGIAVFSTGSGQEAAHGKARFGVRIRRKGMLPGEGLIAQLGHGAKDPFAGFVGGLI